METPTRSKRKPLSLEERMDVVKRSREGETAISIARSLSVGKTQIQNIIRDQDKIVEAWHSGKGPSRKYLKDKKCAHEDVNEKVWDWFCDARSRNITVSAKAIQEQALFVAREFGKHDFAASNGWLDKWRERYHVKCAVLHGDRDGVDTTVFENWELRLPSLCEGYKPSDVFSCGETGIYYRALPSKSMSDKGDGDDSIGCKSPEEKMTVLLAASVEGEKLRPVVIGTSAKPCCLQNTNMMSLGVEYYSDKHAWMTATIFSEWARKLNNSMRLQNRHILMFIDHCPAHPPLSLSNVKFQMLPSYRTSGLQPMDAGIIQAVKVNYRRYFLQNILLEKELHPTLDGPEFAQRVNLLDAVLWLKKSWGVLEPNAISKCFQKCGFFPEPKKETEEVAVESSAEVEEEMEARFHALLDGCTLKEFVDFDNNIQATSLPVPEPESGTTASTSKEEQAGETDDSNPVISFPKAMENIKELARFSIAHGLSDLADTMLSAQNEIFRAHTASLKQTSHVSSSTGRQNQKRHRLKQSKPPKSRAGTQAGRCSACARRMKRGQPDSCSEQCQHRKEVCRRWQNQQSDAVKVGAREAACLRQRKRREKLKQQRNAADSSRQSQQSKARIKKPSSRKTRRDLSTAGQKKQGDTRASNTLLCKMLQSPPLIRNTPHVPADQPLLPPEQSSGQNCRQPVLQTSGPASSERFVPQSCLSAYAPFPVMLIGSQQREFFSHVYPSQAGPVPEAVCQSFIQHNLSIGSEDVAVPPVVVKREPMEEDYGAQCSAEREIPWTTQVSAALPVIAMETEPVDGGAQCFSVDKEPMEENGRTRYSVEREAPWTAQESAALPVMTVKTEPVDGGAPCFSAQKEPVEEDGGAHCCAEREALWTAQESAALPVMAIKTEPVDGGAQCFKL